MRNLRSSSLITALFILTSLLVACSGEKAETNQSNEKLEGKVEKKDIMKDPLELNVHYTGSDSNAQVFMDTYGKIIIKNYPNISFKWTNAQNVPFANLPLLTDPIDIFYHTSGGISGLNDAGFSLDLTDYAKKYKLDLDRIELATLNLVRQVSDGKLIGLPFYFNTHIMFYNVDLFNRFAVAKPKDQMTCDEVYELSRKMTRIDNGVQYLGFSYYFLNGGFLQINPYGESWLDPKTNQVTMAEGRWPAIFRNFERFFQISGNTYMQGQPAADAFSKEGRVAMQITLSNRIGVPDLVPSNWDMVSFPVFPDLPNVGAGVDPFYFTVSTMSKHPEESYLAISSILSDESQLEVLRQGRNPVAKLPNLAQLFATEIPALKGKNTNALVVNKYPSSPVTLTKETTTTQSSLGSAFLAVLQGTKDINTALRGATEDANNKLRALKEAEAAAK